MAAAFEAADGDLAERMMVALEAAEGEGGDIRGKQSAAMLVVNDDRSLPVWYLSYRSSRRGCSRKGTAIPSRRQ